MIMAFRAGNTRISAPPARKWGKNLITLCPFNCWICQKWDLQASAPQHCFGSQADLEYRNASVMFSFPMAKFQYPKWDYQKWNAVEFRLCRPSAATVPALGPWRALGMHLHTDVSVWYSCLKLVLSRDSQLTYIPNCTDFVTSRWKPFLQHIHICFARQK